MKFPLIVQGSPKNLSNGPKVLLRPGNWKVTSNVKDSEFVINVAGVENPPSAVLHIEEPTPVHVTLKKAGRELELNIYLESV